MIKIKWIVLILLIILITLFFLVNTFNHKKTYTNYLALGDSIAEGYALKDKNKRYSKIVQNNYKIEDNNFIDLSKSGMTAQELAVNLNKPEYIDSIKRSDLITISIGSNELLSVLKQIVQEFVLSNPTSNFNTLSNTLLKELQSPNSQKAFQEGVATYQKSWNDILEKIKVINPNATIVATEFYNPYYNLEEIGNISDLYIKQLNTILHDKSENGKIYYIANIYEDFKNSKVNCTNVNTTSLTYNSINLSTLDPHPNVNGHKIMADKIIEVLSAN